MFSVITGTNLPLLVVGVVLAVVSSEEHLTRIGRQSATPGLCVLPEPLMNGRYRPSANRCPPGNVSPACLMAPGAYVPNEWVLFFKCDEGYASNSTQPVTFCKDGRWVPPLPLCKSVSCPKIDAYGVDMKCTYEGETVPCEDPMRPGTVATLTCKEGYVLPVQPRSTQLRCLDFGAWDYPPFYCIPGKVEEVSTTSSTPSLVSTPELLPKVRKSVQKCQEYAATISPGTCTMTETPISDQEDAQPHEFPHMAMIGSWNKSQVIWRCGGSLISERFILTCARCCDDYDTGGHIPWSLGAFARLGAHNIISTRNETGAQDYDIIKRIFHPEFDNADTYYAFALYKLKDNVKFNYFIRPICLQTEDTFVNTYAISTAWWHDNNDKEKNVTIRLLKKDNLTIVDNDECINLYKETVRPDRNFTPSTICAKHHISYGATGETKDSWYRGGPLQIRRQKPHCMYSLVGVLYVGFYRTLKAPWWHMKVSYHVPWIESVVWP